MADATLAEAQERLAAVDRQASRVLVVLALLVMASLLLGKDHVVSWLLEILLIFVNGMVLGIIWCQSRLRRR